MAEIVPFFATETEHKAVDTLPTDTIKPEDVAKAVPKFKDVVCGDLLVQWAMLTTSSDGETVCEFHIYKVDRKKEFDEAHRLLPTVRDSRLANEIARKANAALLQMPWWDNFEGKLIECLSEHFRGSAGRVGYHEEVDSWSATVIPENLALMKWGEDHLDAFASKLWAKING